jgi:hypothetical protein
LSVIIQALLSFKFVTVGKIKIIKIVRASKLRKTDTRKENFGAKKIRGKNVTGLAK